MTHKILCVDDEPNILSGYQRSLRKQFEIETAQSGAEALRKIEDGGTYAVLVTDMRMPGMTGIEFLQEARRLAPEAVRMMLTGNADQHTAAEAVNEGHIFRFLNKPCPPEELARALTDGLEQHRLITAEKELLEKTLGGTIRMLMEILATVDPELFGRAQTLRQNMRVLAGGLQSAGLLAQEDVWPLELAALLAQIGAVTVPHPVAVKVRQGAALSDTEQGIWSRVPETSHHLLRNIPRLEPVAQIVRFQNKNFDGSGSDAGSPGGDALPLGSRMLKVLLDLAELEASKVSRPGALVTMQRHQGRYDPQVLATAMRCLCGQAGGAPKPTSTFILLKDLCCGHVLAEDVETPDGRVLLPAGRQLTEVLLEKLSNYAALAPIREPLCVQVPLHGTVPATFSR